MRLRIGIVFLIALVPVLGVNGEGSHSMKFYVPTGPEASELFKMIDGLSSIEKGDTSLDTEWFLSMYDHHKEPETLLQYCFMAFLRQTENTTIRKVVLDHIAAAKLSDENSNALVRLYAAQKKPAEENGKELFRYECQNGLYDEAIGMFNVAEAKFFEGHLVVDVPDNPWLVVEFPSKDAKASPPWPDNCTLQMPGGPTNSMNITITRSRVSSIQEFKDFVNQSTVKKRLGSSYILEVTREGAFIGSNADSVFMEIGIGKDQFIGAIEDGIVRVSLYSSKYREAYAVEWYMNFSAANNNYQIRDQIWTHMALLAALTWIEN